MTKLSKAPSVLAFERRLELTDGFFGKLIAKTPACLPK